MTRPAASPSGLAARLPALADRLDQLAPAQVVALPEALS
jgi:hypothetical protein